MFRLFFWTFSACFFLNCAAKPRDPEQMASFEAVWETVRDQHWDLASTGVDWNHLHEKYLPQAEQAHDADALRPTLNAMLAELGQSHFRVWGEKEHAELEKVAQKLPSGKGSPGFEAEWVEGRIFITQVESESGAAKAGIKLGDEITKLRGVDSQEICSVLNLSYKKGSHFALEANRKISEFISGPIGSAFQLELQSSTGSKTLDLSWEAPRGVFINLLDINGIYYRYESELEGDVCVVRFNVFTPNTKLDFERLTMPQLSRAKALLIDLRNNPGGLGIISVALANRLVSESQSKLGVMTKKADSLNFVIFPQKPVFTGPIAILINGGSASTSEIFAAGLQDLGRARVFGSRSAGAALPSMVIQLPNGDRFQYAIADYISVKGRHIEGKGVEPDQLTPHSIESMKKGQDQSRNEALKWMKTAIKQEN